MKFTGRSNSLFDQQTGNTTPRMPYDREMNLASNFERTIPLQAALLLVSIAFAFYIGFTGGITDGSERYFDDEMDDMPWLNSSDEPTVMYDTPPQSNVLI